MLETIRLTILYGSETGTAQDIAEEIWKSAKRFHIKIKFHKFSFNKFKNCFLDLD